MAQLCTISFHYYYYLGVSQREPKVKIAFCFLRSVRNRRLGLKTHASLLIVSAHAHD